MPSMASIAPELLAKRMQRAIDSVVANKGVISVFSHHDADGVSAAAVLSRALERAGIHFQTRIIKGLTRSFVDSLDPLKSYIFMDMGSGHVPALEEKHLAIVLDHHKTEKDSDVVIHVNTHILGVDGTSEASASTMAFLFALGLDNRNWDMAPIAAVGMVGDKQHLGGFKGVNAHIMKAAIEKGLLVNKRVLFEGNENISEALANSFDPFFCGLSGDKKAAIKFLSENDFSPEKKVSELSEAEMERLASLLAIDMLERGVDTDAIRTIYGNKLFNPAIGCIDTLVEYSNSSGKSGIGGFAVAMLLGDPWAMDEIKNNFKTYRNILLEKLVYIEKEGIKTNGVLQYFENDDFTLNGAIAGIGMQFILSQDKPFFSMAETNGKVKTSARGTHRQVDSGLDLSAVCRLAAEKAGGEGGGHPIAAGATVPSENKNVFLDEASKLISAQISPNNHL